MSSSLTDPFSTPEGYHRLALANDNDHTAYIAIVTTLGLLYGLLFGAFRWFVRSTICPGVGIDDYLTGIATVLQVIQACVVLGACSTGLGRSPEIISTDDLVKSSKSYYSSTLFFLVAIGLTKISSVYFLKRLASRSVHSKVFTVSTAIIGIWTAGAFFTEALQCNLSYPWLVYGEQCTDSFTRWLGISIVDIITELVLVCLAVFLIWPLQAKLLVKANVIATFAIRLIIIIPVALRLKSLPSDRTATFPLGLILQPLAALQEGENPVPVLDFGEAGPPRCRRCRTYVNPFMTFKSGGNKLVCNMCSFANDVTSDYFAPTDPSGVRVDRTQRPELMLGTVEFTVPKEYWSKEPVGLRYLFLIDTSQEAINRGVLAATCQGILKALYGDDADQDTNDSTEPTIPRIPVGSKIGVVTYDKDINFYNLSPGLTTPQMMVMPDLEDPFVALATGLFVDPVESKNVIFTLLRTLPNMFNLVKNPEPALLPVLNAALAALTATGGKVICSISSLPTFGPGRLHLRDDGKGRDTDHERKFFTTEHPGFKKTAAALVSAGVGVDFFIAAPGGGYMDIATVGHVARLTGGEVFYYPNFMAPRDSLKYVSELEHAVTREIGFQALMKVRCSNGLQVASYHGGFLQHTFGADLEIGSLDADKALGVVFSYDGKLDTKLDAHFQAALLYTAATGQRRVRCINIVAGVCEGAADTMRTVDQDAVVSIMAKEAASKVSEKSLKDIRANLTERTIDILAAYRKNFSGSHPPGQLVLPEHLKEFSMYMLGMLKSRAFKGGIEPTDRRVHSARMLRSCGVTETSLYLYPRIYAIHNLEPEACFASAETGQLVVPPTMRASYARVEEGGAYLVDNGQIILLWLHAQVSPNLLEDLFGPGFNSLQALDPMMNELPVLETHLNAQVRNLLSYIATVRGSKSATIQLARQALDGSEYEFARMLVEDRNNEQQSYVDWLVHVHRSIQMELSGQRKKDAAAAEGESVVQQLTGLKAPYWN